MAGPDVDQVAAAVGEIERLIGDTAQRRGRWGDLHRHLYFGQGHDWHDIREFDWPSVRSDVEAVALSDPDPLPVPAIDLGQAAAGRLTGTATIALPWDRLDDDGFERLLYDLLRDFPEHQNVQWLMQTRAPDRGRDLSLDRVLRDSTGSVRRERVIVQAKHWLKRSVGLTDIANTVAAIKLWQPPVVRGLVIATSGRFSADAVAWTEQHNDGGAAPFIDLWPESKLETLLAQKPSPGSGPWSPLGQLTDRNLCAYTDTSGGFPDRAVCSAGPRSSASPSQRDRPSVAVNDRNGSAGAGTLSMVQELAAEPLFRFADWPNDQMPIFISLCQ